MMGEKKRLAGSIARIFPPRPGYPWRRPDRVVVILGAVWVTGER